MLHATFAMLTSDWRQAPPCAGCHKLTLSKRPALHASRCLCSESPLDADGAPTSLPMPAMVGPRPRRAERELAESYYYTLQARTRGQLAASADTARPAKHTSLRAGAADAGRLETPRTHRRGEAGSGGRGRNSRTACNGHITGKLADPSG